jgi:hypothetical protein
MVEKKRLRDELYAVFTNQEKQAPATTEAQDAVIDKLIEEHGLDKAILVLRQDLREPAYREWKNAKGEIETTKWPLARYIKMFNLHAVAVDAKARNSSFTPEEIAEINRLTTERRHAMFNTDEIADEPGPEPGPDGELPF